MATPLPPSTPQPPPQRPHHHHPTLINLNGALFPPGEARIDVLDHGFLFGDSVYEVVRTSGSKLFTLDEHLERLEQSAQRISLDLPLTRQEFARELERTREAAGLKEAYLRLIVTRGIGEVYLHPASCTRPSYVILAIPLPEWASQPTPTPTRIAFVEVRRNPREALDPAIKSGNYLNNVIAIMQGRKVGADEAVMLNCDGFVTEGTTSNLFWVRNETLETPSLDTGILAGVTRRVVLGLAQRAGFAITEGRFRAEDVRQAEEVFLTSTLRNVMPVSHVDEQPVREPVPGPVTKQLQQLYWERLQGQI